MEAEEAMELQKEDSAIPKKKMESNETSEDTLSDEMANIERITNDEVAPTITVNGVSQNDEGLDFLRRELESMERAEAIANKDEVAPTITVDSFSQNDVDLDLLRREFESMERAEAIANNEKADAEWIFIDDAEVTPEITLDYASPTFFRDFLMWNIEYDMIVEASTSGEKAVEVAVDNAPWEQDLDEEAARKKKIKGKEVVRFCDKCNKKKCRCPPKDGNSKGGIHIRQS